MRMGRGRGVGLTQASVRETYQACAHSPLCATCREQSPEGTTSHLSRNVSRIFSIHRRECDV